MIIYRPHTGSLSESMRNARVFKSIEEMKQYIVADWSFKFQKQVFGADDIVVMPDAIADCRTGWNDTRSVCITRFGSINYEHPQCVGFCATVFPIKS